MNCISLGILNIACAEPPAEVSESKAPPNSPAASPYPNTEEFWPSAQPSKRHAPCAEAELPFKKRKANRTEQEEEEEEKETDEEEETDENRRTPPLHDGVPLRKRRRKMAAPPAAKRRLFGAGTSHQRDSSDSDDSPAGPRYQLVGFHKPTPADPYPKIFWHSDLYASPEEAENEWCKWFAVQRRREVENWFASRFPDTDRAAERKGKEKIKKSAQ